MNTRLASIALVIVALNACDSRDVSFQDGTGGGVGAATGGVGATTGGSGGAAGSGGSGGASLDCRSGYVVVGSQQECYADASCYALADGRWCTGNDPIQCAAGYKPVWFEITRYECLPTDACPSSFRAIADASACPSDGTCYELSDGSWCAELTSVERCPTGFSLVTNESECIADAICYGLADGSFCTGSGASLEPAVIQALVRYQLEVTGTPEVLVVALPGDPAATAQWGVVEAACQSAGYSLAPYAGQTVNLTRFAANTVCQADLVDARIMTQENVVVCVYYSVRPPAGSVPGIYSVDSSLCR